MPNISDIERISIQEFRDKGYLQETNRQFLHPLGLALEVRHGWTREQISAWLERQGIHFGSDAIDNVWSFITLAGWIRCTLEVFGTTVTTLRECVSVSWTPTRQIELTRSKIVKQQIGLNDLDTSFSLYPTTGE